MAAHKMPNGANRHLPSPVLGPRAQLSDFDFFRRLDFLHTHQAAQFLPTTREEVNDAFRLMYANIRRGETAQNVLERILGHQAVANTVRPVAAVESRIGKFVSYAAQAKHDKSMLEIARREVVEALTLPEIDPSTTLRDLFSGTPAHSGPGQIVRYLDMKAVAENGSVTTFGFDPYDGEVRKKAGLRTRWGVIDPYTPSALPTNPHVSEHMDEVLGSTYLEGSEDLITEAYFDQMAREKFWEWQLQDAGRDAQGNPAAQTVS
jgi:hypothetical protein